MFAPKPILTFGIACLGFAAPAQNTVAYESISVAQGLSQGMVLAILQDREGFIWVGTKNGLNRYDGYGFRVFTNDPYNEKSLSSNTVTALLEDSKGRIWVGTENAGLNVYDKKTAQFYRIAHRPDDAGSISGNRIRNSMIETNDGKILVPVDDGGFNMIALPDNFLAKKTSPAITRLALPDNRQVYGIGKDKAGQIWLSSYENKVYHFDAANNRMSLFSKNRFYNSGYGTPDGDLWINSHFFLSDGASTVPLFDTNQLNPGNLLLKCKPEPWINFHEELFYYDISKREAGKPIRWNDGLFLTKHSKVLFPFLIDRSGILWTGTKGYGLRKYNVAQSRFRRQLPGFSVRYIVPSSNGILLGAYPYEWKILRKDSAEKKVFNKILPLNLIDNIIVAKYGHYWIRTDDKGLFRYHAATGKLTAFPSVQFNAGQGDKQPMLEDSKGNIWLPALGGTFTRIHPVTGRADTFTINTNRSRPMLTKALCTALYEDGQQMFWAGTEEGFAKIDFKGNENHQPVVTWYSNSPTDRNSLNYDHVSCFLDDPAEPDKYIWIGTKGGGLNRMNKSNGDFFHLTAKDGLPNDVVYGILPDGTGNIWGSTNKGIFCLMRVRDRSGSQWQFRNFTKTDGLQDDEFNTGAYARLDNGNLAFGGVNGLNIFDPAKVLVAGYSPAVYITDISVNNQPLTRNNRTGISQSIERTKNITLNWSEDILTLEFSSLDFTAPAQNKYRYQLVGVDKDWVESGTRRSATYLHLPSGNFTFRVQGSNSQGVWSDKIAELQITVLPPWWRTWWAYTVYGLMLLLSIRIYFKFTINRARLRSQLNFEQLEARRIKELDNLKTQLYTNITHEFRTPLTVIMGMAQQVINKPEEHLKNGMDMIVRNGRHLLNLVNEMLDLSKLETGKMQLQLVNGDIINFLRYIVESFHSLARSQQKQLHFLTDIDDMQVAYDPEKIRKIVTNLLSNALKFTPENGNIYISISTKQTPGNDSDTLVVKVKDTGIGIPENDLLHIFDRFYQLDNSATRKAEGTGIGLTLTRELVKLMEGEIMVKSPPAGLNQGSEFTVILPLKRTAATEAPDNDFSNNDQQPVYSVSKHVRTAEQNTGTENPVILLVEDNADVVAYTASCLPEYRLFVGQDGREGFDIAREKIPDLIITDVMMPFVDGFELCRMLRNDEHTSHIPIIMLTAKADMESKIEGLQQGADVYLEKPFDREELLVRIKKLLELRRNLQQYYLRRAGINNVTPISTPSKDAVPRNKIEDAFVKKVTEIIEKNLSNTDFTVEQLCKLIFMSHSQLHRKLDALTGYSPNKFIRIIRLNKARELLQNPENSIGSIAIDSGYHDPGYFGRVFKQEYGMTPQEWRMNNK